MTPDSVSHTPDEEPLDGSLSYGKLSLLLAAALGIIVVLINLLSPEEIAVSEGTFRALVEDEKVTDIVVGDGWLNCILVGDVTVEEQTGVGTRPRKGSRVSVNLTEVPSVEEQQQWRHAGIGVYPADADALAKRARGQQIGWLLMAVLLGIGLYYIISQAKRSKRFDSPRGRLAKLEQAWKDGDISREDYDRKAEAISAEL